jgi:hypothetical protein
MSDEHKEVIWNTQKGFWDPNEGLSWETRNLIIEKNEDKLEKEGQLTKRV